MRAKRHLKAFRWRADDGPLLVVFGSSLPSPTKTITNKNIVKVGPPLNKLPSSADALYHWEEICTEQREPKHYLIKTTNSLFFSKLIV